MFSRIASTESLAGSWYSVAFCDRNSTTSASSVVAMAGKKASYADANPRTTLVSQMQPTILPRPLSPSECR